MKPGGAMHIAAVAAFLLSAAAALAAGIAGPGYRAGWWGFRQGFDILRWAAYLGAAGAAASILAAIFTRPGSGRRGFAAALAGIALGATAFGVPYGWSRIAGQVPRIHDITTDTDDPPAFVAILPLRKDAPNPAEYGGPEIAAKQRAAYPDIRPFKTGISTSRAYEAALVTAERMKWEVVEENPAEGRIEAVATTRWFGFKDDVVIRISPTAEGGCVLDIRSVSRVGISDVGANARRIRAFLGRFAKTAGSGG
ncbi:MAG: DUF1499 domain-containing protein [Thermodesulfobacteriota bacterium]